MSYQDDANTVALYHLRDSGATVVDSSSNGYHGTQTGMVTEVDGLFGFAMESDDDTNDRIEVDAISAGFDSAAGSIEFFFRATTLGHWSDAAAHWLWICRVDNNNEIEILKNVSNNIVARYTAGGTGVQLTTIPTPDDLFDHHYKITWDKPANEMRFFFDGVQSGATQTGLGVWAGTLANATLGATQLNTDGFEGVYEELRISSVARLTGVDWPMQKVINNPVFYAPASPASKILIPVRER